MSQHVVVPVSLYQRIFVTLIVLTVVTVAVALIDLGEWNAVVALSIASLKASLVALYFMGLRWGDRVTRVAVVVALAGVALLFGASLNDDLTRESKTYLPAELRPELLDFSVQGLDGLTPELAPPAAAPDTAHGAPH
jgi:cytochrome c oxidase subunit 4